MAPPSPVEEISAEEVEAAEEEERQHFFQEYLDSSKVSHDEFRSWWESRQNEAVIEYVRDDCLRLLDGMRFKLAMRRLTLLEFAFGSCQLDLKTIVRQRYFEEKLCASPAYDMDFQTDTNFIFSLGRHITSTTTSISHIPILRNALEFATCADRCAVVYALHVMQECRREFYADTVRGVDPHPPVEDDLIFVNALVEEARAHSDNSDFESSKCLFKHCLHYLARARIYDAIDLEVSIIEEHRKASERCSNEPAIEASPHFHPFGVFAKQKKQLVTHEWQARYRLSHVEIVDHLYQGSIVGGEKVSFFPIADSAKFYTRIASMDKIRAMVQVQECKDFYIDNKGAGVVCIKKVNSYNQFLLGRIASFEQREQSKIGLQNVSRWIIDILPAFRRYFRRVVGGILDFHQNDIVPKDLKCSICIDSSDEIKLIPSPDCYDNSTLDQIISQLKVVLSKTFFPHEPTFGEYLTPANLSLLPVDVKFFCQALCLPNISLNVGNNWRFLLCAPCFWTLEEKTAILWNLQHIKSNNAIPKEFWKKDINSIRPFKLWDANGVEVDAWAATVAQVSSLKTVYDFAGSTYKDAIDELIRFVGNLLRHYDDGQFFSLPTIVQFFLNLFPLFCDSFYVSFLDYMNACSPDDLKICIGAMTEFESDLSCWSCN